MRGEVGSVTLHMFGRWLGFRREVEVTGDGALVFVSYDVMEHFVDV